LNTFEEPPAAAPINYAQVVISDTTYNNARVLALRPGELVERALGGIHHGPNNVISRLCC
jgi:hypothetical protein